LNPHCQSRKILKISSERKKQRGKMAEMEEGFCSLISPKGLHRLGTWKVNGDIDGQAVLNPSGSWILS